MTPQENTQLVQGMYAAFGAGDIQKVIASVSSDVSWVDGGTAATPFSGGFSGLQGVGEFFKRLGEHQEFLAFEPREFVAQGNTVVALGYLKAKSRATGKTYETDWAMSFHIDNGKVRKFRSFYDSAVAAAAYRN